jgi:hypothetical protein
MARIVERFSVPASPAQSFAYVADFTNTRDWDPMIEAASRREAGPLQVGSAFDVALRVGSRVIPLVYTITELLPDEHVVLETSGSWYRGKDDVRVRGTDEGSEIRWDATFALRGPLLIVDPLLAVGFRRTARLAVAGLRAALTALPDEKDAR